MTLTRPHTLLLFGLLLLLILLISGIHPYDRATWLMEVAPVLIAVPVLVATYLSDMFLAFLGATIALAALSRWHDRQMSQLAANEVISLKSSRDN